MASDTNFMKPVHWLLARLEEPSTFAGGSIVVVSIMMLFPGAVGIDIVAALAAIGGMLAIVMPEKAVEINLPADIIDLDEDKAMLISDEGAGKIKVATKKKK